MLGKVTRVRRESGMERLPVASGHDGKPTADLLNHLLCSPPVGAFVPVLPAGMAGE